MMKLPNRLERIVNIGSLLFMLATPMITACSRGSSGNGSNPVIPQNSAPETFISSVDVQPNLVRISGYGEDLDGEVEKIICRFDSEEPDTIYGPEFSVEGRDFSYGYHSFSARAIDNEGEEDPSMATSSFFVPAILETLVIKPDSSDGKDTHISKWSVYDSEGNLLGEAGADNNFGSEPKMFFREERSDDGSDLYQKRALLRFDMSAIPDGVEIDSATLFLWGRVFYGEYGHIGCHRILGEWSENDATWNNTNHLIEEDRFSSVYNFGAHGLNWYYTFIGDLVRDWVENPEQNYGVAVFPDPDSGVLNGEIFSSDFPFYEERPSLHIGYVTNN